MGIWISINPVAARHDISNWLVEVSGGLIAINMLHSAHHKSGDNQGAETGQRIFDQASLPWRAPDQNSYRPNDKQCSPAQGGAAVKPRGNSRPPRREGTSQAPASPTGNLEEPP